MDNTFNAQNAIGKQGEALIMNALRSKGHNIEDVSGKYEYQQKDIDLRLEHNGLIATLEVKNDIRSNETGNVFVETYNKNNMNRNYDGWACYCEADYIAFIQISRNVAHIVSRTELIKNCWSGLYREVNSPFSRGYIVPITCLKHYNSYHSLELE